MVRKFRTAADIAVAASAAYAVFGAAVAYPAAAPTATALAFAAGYGALLFLLPFSVFAIEFLRPPRGLHRTPRSMVACAVATPVALLATVLSVLGVATRPGGGGGGDGAVLAATAAVWAADVAAVAALGWCLTNAGFTPVALNRYGQYANFVDAMERKPGIRHPFKVVGDPAVARREAVRFVVAVSAACAAAGGAAVGALSPAGGLASGATAACVLFALPMCLLYAPEYLVEPEPTVRGVLRRNPMAAWCVLLAPVGLVLCRLVAAIVKGAATGNGTFVAVSAGTGVTWTFDAVAAVLLGRHIAKEITRPSMFRASSSEIASALLMVCLRYWLYLHVFHVIGCGDQLFNSPEQSVAVC